MFTASSTSSSLQSKINSNENLQHLENISKGFGAVNFMSRTMAVHVRYISWFISLPSSVKQQREMTKFCVVWRAWTTTSIFLNFHFKFFFLFQIFQVWDKQTMLGQNDFLIKWSDSDSRHEGSGLVLISMINFLTTVFRQQSSDLLHSWCLRRLTKDLII